jgi:hypothetical protein
MTLWAISKVHCANVDQSKGFPFSWFESDGAYAKQSVPNAKLHVSVSTTEGHRIEPRTSAWYLLQARPVVTVICSHCTFCFKMFPRFGHVSGFENHVWTPAIWVPAATFESILTAAKFQEFHASRPLSRAQPVDDAVALPTSFTCIGPRDCALVCLGLRECAHWSVSPARCWLEATNCVPALEQHSSSSTPARHWRAPLQCAAAALRHRGHQGPLGRQREHAPLGTDAVHALQPHAYKLI